MHLNGAVFAATILAATTALPELTTGITAVRMHDYELAISDIIGGNAFLPVLFLFAVVISNDPVLPHATTTDIYLAALGIILTMIYACGAIFRWQHRILGVGADSALVVAAYAFGIAGMFSLR
jgi:cation:H+ antiporter